MHFFATIAESKISLLFLFTFIIIFFVNVLSQIIYSTIIENETTLSDLKYKVSEILILISFFFLLLILLKLKKFWKATNSFTDFSKNTITLILLILHCEFEILNSDVRINNEMTFGFILGFFVMHSIENNKKINTFFNMNNYFFVIEILYCALRFNKFHPLHLQKLFTLLICLLLFNKFKFMLEKKHQSKYKEKKIEETPENYSKQFFWKRVIQDFDQEAIAVFNQTKTLIVANEKMSTQTKFHENLKENLFSNQVRYVPMPKNEEFSKDSLNMILFQDFLNENPTTSLETVINHFFSIFLDQKLETSFPQTLKYSFELLKNLDSTTQILTLTFILKANKPKGFLIRIQTHTSSICSTTHLTVEKQSQNNKIFFVSHEMRTPLNCIVSMLQILKPFIAYDLAKDYLNPAIISCNFLLYLVQDLLDMAQMESDKFTMNFEEFDIRILLSDTIELFNIQASSKNTGISMNVSKFVPELIMSDHRRIKQILINLIGNALKFMKKNNGTIIIEVNIDVKNPTHIIIEVKDNGIGIKEEDRKKLFQAFGKINNEENKKRNSNGVGLGLMISNDLAQNLHPTKAEGLRVDSKYGMGTIFSFIIEDKNEIANVRDIINEKGLMDNYQNLLKLDDKCHFLIKKEKESNNASPNCLSLKVNLHSRFSTIRHNFLQLTPLLKPDKKFDSKEHNEKVMIRRKTIKKQFSQKLNCKLVSLQSFGDVFFGKKNLDDYEASEAKMMIQKEFNQQKTCQCPDILICDDNAFNNYSLKKQVEAFSFIIESANDGEEAIKMVQDNYELNKNCCANYQLIFMDIEMPGINGYETSKEIRKFLQGKKRGKAVKIVACSAHINEEKQNMHKEFGMDEFVSKPIIKGRLMMLLAKFINIVYDFKDMDN